MDSVTYGDNTPLSQWPIELQELFSQSSRDKMKSLIPMGVENSLRLISGDFELYYCFQLKIPVRMAIQPQHFSVIFPAGKQFGVPS